MQHDSPLQQAKRELRSTLLEQRMALSTGRRHLLDRQLCARVVGFLSESSGVRVSAFWPFRGEPDLRPALIALHEAGRQVHLPVLLDSSMQFRRWTPTAEMQPNQYGIAEPVAGAICAPDDLNWVMMPLVGFSAAGGRLGMGGGFYDRAFASRRSASGSDGPALVGVGYGFQEVDSLPVQHWDVPLDAVITDRGTHRCRDFAL